MPDIERCSNPTRKRQIAVCDKCGPLPHAISLGTVGTLKFNHEYGHPGHNVTLVTAR